MTALIILLILAYIPAHIAEKKGRSFTLWYIYAVALWIVAMIHCLIISDNNKINCPFCQKSISKKALICPYCHSDLGKFHS